MCLKVRRSVIEPALLEVWEGKDLIQEISAPFLIRKIPPSFTSLEEIHKWLAETEWKLARFRAYRLLAMRNYASITLQRKLEEKRFSSSVCERVIEELKQSGLIRDEEFLEAMILREFRRGYGPKYIELKMRSKGLVTSKIRELVTNEMQKEKMRELVQKARLEKKKAMQLLQRRGFDLSLIFQIL